MDTKHKLLIGLLLLALLALAGCMGAATATPTAPATAAPTNTASRTPTPEPSATETISFIFTTIDAAHTQFSANQTKISSNRTLTPLAPTKTASNTPTITITPTITNTAFPPPTRQNTLEPLATLSDFDAENLVLDLMENNNGCSFPCFWGITPGETEWREAFQFLDTFDVAISKREYEIVEGIQTSIISHNNFYFQIPGVEHESNIEFTAKDGIVEYIEVKYLREYSIQKILRENGIPEEIWVFNNDNYAWTLILYYPSKGFLSSNLGYAPDIIDKNYHLCFDGIWCRVLELWSNEEILTFNEKNNFEGDTINPFVPLEDITDFTIEAFYETFVNADSVCIDFPFDEYPEGYVTPTPTP